PRKMMYLIGQSRSCRPQGTVIWGTRSFFAPRLRNSCSAPKGQSQPQNGPRPQNKSPAATAVQRMKINGAARKNSHENTPLINEVKKVSTLTTESCALTVQPSQSRTKAR